MSQRLAYRLRHAGHVIPVMQDDSLWYAGHTTPTRQVCIGAHETGYRWHETLLHELIHVAESLAMQDEAIPACATECYVEEVGKRLFALLWDNGFYRALSPEWMQTALDFEGGGK